MWQSVVGILLAGGLALAGAAISPRWTSRRRRRWEVLLCALAGGLAGALIMARTPALFSALPQLVLAGILITVSLVDLHDRIIPNEAVIVGLAAGLLFQLLVPRISWLSALGGGALGFGVLLLLGILYKGGMGMGDVKLAGVFGLYLGLSGTLVALTLSFLVGGVVSLLLLALGKVGRKDHIPFGPFLAIGALVAMLYGEDLLIWLGY